MTITALAVCTAAEAAAIAARDATLADADDDHGIAAAYVAYDHDMLDAARAYNAAIYAAAAARYNAADAQKGIS